jgi:hypothetical protein
MVSKKFNNAVDIVNTRTTLGGPEENAIRILFGKTPLSEESLTALKIAQAAERAYKLAEKAGTYAQKHEAFVDYYKKINERVHPQLREYINEKEAGVVEYDDPVFDSVGAEKDPELLRLAQATWMAAQMYMNHEIRSIKEDVTVGGFLGRMQTTGPAYADGFKRFSSEFYVLAAQMLEKEGHAEAAERLEAVGKAMMKYGIDNQNAPVPTQFLTHLLSQERGGIQDANIVLSGEYWTLPKRYEDTLLRLTELTKPPKSPPAAKTAPHP